MSVIIIQEWVPVEDVVETGLYLVRVGNRRNISAFFLERREGGMVWASKDGSGWSYARTDHQIRHAAGPILPASLPEGWEICPLCQQEQPSRALSVGECPHCGNLAEAEKRFRKFHAALKERGIRTRSTLPIARSPGEAS